MIFSPNSIKICLSICIGVPVVFGMFRGDFGDFIPPRRSMQIMVPELNGVTSTTGCIGYFSRQHT